MLRIPFVVGLVGIEECLVEGQEEVRQVFDGDDANLFAHDAFADSVVAAGVDVEGRFHFVADFLAGTAQAQGSQLLDRAVRRTAREMAFRQEVAVDAAVFEHLGQFDEGAVRIAQALLADRRADAADGMFKSRRRRVVGRKGCDFAGFVGCEVDDISRFVGVEADFSAFHGLERLQQFMEDSYFRRAAQRLVFDVIKTFLFLFANAAIFEDAVVGTALGQGRFFFNGQAVIAFGLGFRYGIADGLTERIVAELIEDEAGTVLAAVFIVAVFHVDVPAIAQDVVGNIQRIDAFVDEDAEARAVEAETAAGIDVEGVVRTGHEAQVLEGSVAFVVETAGETDLIFSRQVELGNTVDDEISCCLDVRRHVEVFARSDAVERTGRDVTRIVAAGADAVNAVVETFLIEVEDFFFVQVVELQGFTRREVDEVDVIAVEDILQKGDVCRFDGTARKTQAQHVAMGPPFAIAAELARRALIFGRRQFLGIKSPRRFGELRETAAYFFFCFLRDLSHFINTP